MKSFKLAVIFMLIFSSLSCAAQNEVQVKSYEDYFPSTNTGYGASEQDGYDTYTYEEPSESSQVTEEGKAYSDDGYFQEAPVEIDAAVKSTGKCKAVAAPGPKKIGKPYKINGVTYYPMESADGYSEVGIASGMDLVFMGN